MVRLMGISMSINKCRICLNENSNSHFLAFEKMFGTNQSFDYFICSECGCLQITEEIKDMRPHYPDDYYSFEENKSLRKRLKEKVKRLYFKFASTNHLRIESQGLGAFDLNSDTKILDIGCGRGNFIKFLKSKGLRNVSGVDPFVEKDIHLDGEVLVRKQHIEDIDEKFDIVMLHHSFEHIFEQVSTMESLRNLLKENGTLMIRIPLLGHAFDKYKENWVSLDAPRHFFLHTEKSMKELAFRTGFNVQNVVYDSTDFQFWGSEQYINGIPLFSDKSYAKNDSVIEPEKIREYQRLAKELNESARGDQACFYLTKS
ncbi:MAG: class I SAM-dependent methyltransferase [Deltaproteobacteria bacterium]|nr:MAG: class I SAM-dependent methyltransferase [Deltaproteobacteria bacterium]